MILREALRSVLAGETLARAESRDVFATALDEATDPVLLGGFLCALAARGETPAELAGAVDALRAAMVPFEVDAPDAIDTCGTGGDGLETFNLSTTAAIVACAAGARVVKHGNRSLSSRCGSADLLEAAGVRLDLSPERSRAVFDEVGITFLFAPSHHPALRFAGPVRKALGVRTAFNFLGPLVNPGRVRRQLVGVPEPARVEHLAAVLEELGHASAYVVHGAGGADELTLAGPNVARAVGDAPEVQLDARELGLAHAPVEALRGGDATTNLALLRGVLDGDTGPIADAVVLNAGAALLVAGPETDARGAVARAREALESGAARTKLALWVEATR